MKVLLMPYKAHVSDAKKKEVKLLEGLLKQYPVIAIAPISGLPASHFQFMRKKLRGHAELRRVGIVQPAVAGETMLIQRLGRGLDEDGRPGGHRYLSFLRRCRIF